MLQYMEYYWIGEISKHNAGYSFGKTVRQGGSINQETDINVVTRMGWMEVNETRGFNA